MMLRKFTMGAVAAVLCAATSFAEYNVRRPADSFRPAWTGAKAGQWTMDYKSAMANAKADGKCTLMLVSGSWWCPHCEAFEEKVLLSDEWRQTVSEEGYYLTLLDFPYRGTVKPEEQYKSIHPELGPGWGFQCWLYDADYLAENGLTVEDGLREIQKRYELQKALADESAAQVTIRTWDGTADFTYGKVGYPTIIVFLPDGTEAGRFVPFVTYMEAAEARTYVIEQIEAIVTSALDAQCGLCSDPEEGGLDVSTAQSYLGYLTSGDSKGVRGTVAVTTSRLSRKGEVTAKAKFSIGGKGFTLRGTAANGEKTFVLTKGRKDVRKAVLRFGAEGLSGTYDDGVSVFKITGARNAFVGKDAESIAQVASYEKGTWNVAMGPAAGAPAFARGYGHFTVTLKARGSAGVSGRLADGTRITATSKVIPGENGVFCLPVAASLYSKKKGGFSCNLWFREGILFNVTDVGDWVAAGDAPFVARWKPIFSGRPGFSGTDPEMELTFAGLPTELFGLPLVENPDLDEIAVKRTKWRGTDLSAFSATCNAKTGVISGSLLFRTLSASGREKNIKATVSGAVIDGKAYCSALVKRAGSWAVKILSCAECDE